MSEKTILTQEGYNKIKEEYEYLITVRRKEVAEHLKEARSYGDLSENAEYDAAKNEQVEVEANIQKLEAMMRDAEIIDHADVPVDKVGVSLHVDIKNIHTGETFTYKIVPSNEINVFEGHISYESAIGKELLGHEVGDVVKIEVPSGDTLEMEVLRIYK